MNLVRIAGAALTLLLVGSVLPAEAAAKAGGPCNRPSAKATIAGKRYTCVRVGSKRVWRLAKPIVAASPKPAAPGEFTVVPAAKRVSFPVWSGNDLEGNPWSTSTLAGGLAVVNIWASWCEPCRSEWPALQASAAAHPTVRFIGINTIDKLESARAFLKQQPSSYLQVFDDRGVIKSSLTTVPNFILPITMILDAKGRIAAWVPGPTTRDYLDRALASLQ
jgi:thiol-disulfide isomerase/thioredoxin